MDYSFDDIFIDDTKNVERVSSNEYLENGNIAIIDQGKEQIVGYTNCEEYKICNEERIIFGDHTRIFKYVNIPFITGADGTKVLKIKDVSKCAYKYYYYYLLHSYIPNTGYNRHFKWVKELKFKVPEISEQKEIIKKIDNVVKIIDIKKIQLDELQNVIKSQFVEMFGNININDKKWNEDILKHNLSVIGGYAFKSSEFQESGIPILRIGNINTGKFRTKDLMFWKNDASLERYAIYPNDVLMSLTGTVGKEDYGNICIIGNDYPKYYLNQRNAKLEIKETLNKEYISYALRVPEIKRRLTGISRGVRQANISNKDIENLRIPIPPIELQNKFAEFVKQIDKQKFESEIELRKIQKNIFYKWGR